MPRQIIGAKGGSGGAAFVTKPDSLRSNDSFEILLGLGSGRWKGLVEGLKGLKINGVPMENADGTSNFQDVVAIFADGNPLEQQVINFKLGGGGATQQVNTALANPNTGTPGPWVSGAVSTQNADFIDLRFVVQSLFYQDKKSIRENTANIEVQMRPSNSGTWINIFSAPASSSVTYDPDGYDNNGKDSGLRVFASRQMFNDNGVGFKASGSPYLAITGKTNSAFVKELRVAVPKEGNYTNVGWEVRARLIEKDTIDENEIQQRRAIAFESISAIIKEPLGVDPMWAGQVWLQLIGKASDQFNGFPTVDGIFDTKICKTPPTNIWNPETRVYTGTTWDGSYEEHFTTDPAWQIKEFVEDPIHGLAGLQPGSTLDKWDALEASKYYSELVSDGKGGTHPRFNLNLTLNEAQDVNNLMSFLAGAVNSYTEDVGDGKWRLKVDKPEAPKAVFTEDNIFGQFNYSHTDVDTRFNDWRGTFLNEDFNYEQDTVRVHDQNNIDENGTRFTEIALVGCTNRQEALRRLMFRQRIALNEYKIVRFTTNRFGRYIGPLDTILVADGALNADYLVKTTSRLQNITGNVVNLKRAVRLEVGVNYVLRLTKNDLTTATLPVTNASNARGDVTAINFSGAIPVGVMVDSAVALEAVNLPSNPLPYRVISVERDEENEDLYSITASIIDSGKWNAMDNVSEQAIQTQTTGVEIDSPTVPIGGMFDVLTYATDFGTKRVLQVNWDRPGGLFLEGFRVEYRLNDGPWKLLSANLKDSVIELERPQDGIYDFKITALDRRGVQSNPLIGRYDLLGDAESVIPTHIRGELEDRPLEGPYDGFRYTAVNSAGVTTTYVWEDGVWKAESNLITEGSQIGVENGATVGAPIGTIVADRLAETLVDDVDLNAQTLLAYTFDNQTLRDYVDARLYVSGEPVNAVVAEEKTERIEGQNSLAQKIGLIGATNVDSSAFVINLTTAQVGGGTTLGDKLTEIDAVSTSLTTLNAEVGTYSSSITNLQTALVTPSGGASAKAIFQLNANGHVQGYEATNNGVTGKIIFTFDSFELRDPSGVALFTASGGVVKMPNVEVETIKIGAVGTAQLAANAVTVPSTTAGSDTFVSAGGTATLLETGFINVGDVNGGGAVLLAFGELDGGSTSETACRLYLYIDSGSGYVLSATTAAGARTNSGADTYLKAALLASATVSGVTSIRARVDAMSFAMPGSTARSFTIRSPQLIIMGAKR